MRKFSQKRRDEAKVRQELHDKLTAQQKIAKLDAKLGKGVGAKKERAKLQSQLEVKTETK